jgi:hypothetical protein
MENHVTLPSLHDYMSPLQDPILSQFNPVHNLTSCFFKIHILLLFHERYVSPLRYPE